MKASLALLLLGATALLPAAPVSAARPSAKDGRTNLLDAMEAELKRSMERLKLPGYETPYFIAYTVRERDDVDVTAKFGALIGSDHTRERGAYVEVRVGGYDFDNTADEELDADWDSSSDDLYLPSAELPVDDDAQAVRGVLWLLTDARYKAALSALNQKRGHRATRVIDDESVPAFARTPKVTSSAAPLPLQVDQGTWEQRVRTASARLKGHPGVFDSSVRFQAGRETRLFVTSEGSRVVSERILFALHVSLVGRAADGVLLEHGRSYYGEREADLPSPALLTGEIDRLAGELEALRKAPTLDPYTGPAILMEEATGVLFHEVVGHRLEGERLSDENEGQTFKGQIGQRVIPPFLSVVDDPTKRKQGTTPLNGYYLVDDEGVAARPVTLIDAGVLKTYLTSRRPVKDVETSNGHGRAEGANNPMARMGNLIVRSSKQVAPARLKELLLDEVRKQGKPFGLIIRDITGGSTNTASYGYQAFKGTPRLVYKVDAKTGAETLVRGVEMVGTPLTSINKIIATSDTVGVFNGFCGAESGFVPVSTVAPAVLLQEIELQRAQRVKQKPAILPPPWSPAK